jgi:serine/threonine protein phosphatase PrpC
MTSSYSESITSSSSYTQNTTTQSFGAKSLFQNDLLIADFLECQGNERKYMEDGFVNKTFVVAKGLTCHVFGVLDGHGGDDVMRWLRQYIPFYVRQTIVHHNCDWTKMCLDMNDELRLKGSKAGSTMSLLIVLVNEDPFVSSSNPSIKSTNPSVTNANPNDGKTYRMCIVNVGDSAIAASTHCASHPWKNRCTACLSNHKQLTTSHDLKSPEERRRLQKQKKIKISVEDDQYITNGNRALLNMTRAFGDFGFGSFVKPIPQVIYINKPLCFVTMASDGIWDIATPKEIVDWSANQCSLVDAQGLNQCIMKQRSKRKQHDNYTMGVLFFDTSKFTPW